MNALNHHWPEDGQIQAFHRPSLFQGISVQEDSWLRNAFDCETYVDGDLVRRPQILGLVARGALREEMTHEGKPHLFSLVFEGEVLVPQGPRTRATHLIAMGPTEILTCPPSDFARLCAEIPMLRLNMLQIVQDQLEATQAWQVLLGRKTASERVASLLFDVYRRQEGQDMLTLGLSRAEIGQMLGLTLETTSRQIRALEKAGIVTLPGRGIVRVIDAQRLHQQTGDLPGLRQVA
jgi:CRP-like cAMP-binding protein